MSIQIPADLEAYVQGKVDSGEYTSKDDFTAEAIRIFRDMEKRHDQLKGDIEHAISQSDSGESQPLDMEAIKAKARRRYNDQQE